MLALHHRRLQTQLGGADRRDIASRAAADEDQIEGSVGHPALLQHQPHGVFDQRLERGHEAGADDAVDHPVIAR